MKTHESNGLSAHIAVLVRGRGFYYAIRHVVGHVIEDRYRRRAARRTAEELARLPDYLKQDINWPSIASHEDR
jgi:hypothetical protein